MASFILVHPNNQLIKTTNYTIPNLESYKASLSTQLIQLHQPIHKRPRCLMNINEDRIRRLISYKSSELKYIESYLKILKNLDVICKTCQLADSSYDYEREDEILLIISEETKLMKMFEIELAKNKSLFETDGRCDNASFTNINNKSKSKSRSISSSSSSSNNKSNVASKLSRPTTTAVKTDIGATMI